MLSDASMSGPEANWVEYEERFHAISVYLHQIGLGLKTVSDKLILSPNINQCPEPLPLLSDHLMRTKLDKLSFSSYSIDSMSSDQLQDQSMQGRALNLLQRMRVDCKPTAQSNNHKPDERKNDFTAVRQYYSPA